MYLVWEDGGGGGGGGGNMVDIENMGEEEKQGNKG